MMHFETDIPIPPVSFGGKVKKFYLEDMKVGESQLIPYGGYSTPESARGTVGKIAGRVSKAKGYRFTVRRLDTGVRIWRVA